mgnify:CR=1 FL=1
MNKYNFDRRSYYKNSSFKFQLSQNDFNQRAFLELLNHASSNLGKNFHSNIFSRKGKKIESIQDLYDSKD